MTNPCLEFNPLVAFSWTVRDMTDNIAIVEYGSHTFRAGLAYVFPSDQEPRLVRYALSCSCRLCVNHDRVI